LTDYYNGSDKFGTKEEAIKNLKLFGEEILLEDKDLRKRIITLPTYKPLI
jgi:hypothetical protein